MGEHRPKHRPCRGVRVSWLSIHSPKREYRLLITLTPKPKSLG